MNTQYRTQGEWSACETSYINDIKLLMSRDNSDYSLFERQLYLN